MIRITSSVEDVDLRLAHRWIASSYWASGIPWVTFERSCANSLVFAALDGASQVGFARVVTDQATFAWVCDVFVVEESRQQGVGTKLISTIMADARLTGLRRLLLATAAAHGLYARFGFERLGDASGRLMGIRHAAADLYQRSEPGGRRP